VEAALNGKRKKKRFDRRPTAPGVDRKQVGNGLRPWTIRQQYEFALSRADELFTKPRQLSRFQALAFQHPFPGGDVLVSAQRPGVEKLDRPAIPQHGFPSR